jgi:hypothetical protein
MGREIVEPTIIRTLHDGWSPFKLIEKLLVVWCRIMHNNITWPHRSHYECRTCGRCYAVPWAAQEHAGSHGRVIEIGQALEHARTA